MLTLFYTPFHERYYMLAGYSSSWSTWKVVHMVHALFCEERFCIWGLLYRLTIVHMGGIQGLQSKLCFTPNSVMMYRNPTNLIDSTMKQVQSLDVYISRLIFFFELKCHVCDLCIPTFTWSIQYGLGRIDHFVTDPFSHTLICLVRYQTCHSNRFKG